MKRILILLGIALILFSLTGCSAKSKGLVIWSFTNELGEMINGRLDEAGNETLATYYKKEFPNVEIDYTLTPTAQFTIRLDPVLANGQGAPDVFALESSFVRKYVESGLLLDLTDIYEANKDKLLAYPVEVGTYNGRVYALSGQACPGAMFYRRSYAREYLGTDDPAEVQALFSDLGKFQETAARLKNASGNSCVVVASLKDLFFPFLESREEPWIVDGRLVIDPVMEQYMDLCKTLHDNRWYGRVENQSEGWFAGMNGDLSDETGPVEVFSYFVPTWGLHYWLKLNGTGTVGDWAMIPGPVPYRWGGTWLGAYKNTEKAEEAKHLIEWITTNDDFLESWARATGDFVSNLNVVNKIKDEYDEPFLGGQNHYAEFAQMALGVSGRLVQANDQEIEGYFHEATLAFVNGEKTKETALADFRQQVEALLK